MQARLARSGGALTPEEIRKEAPSCLPAGDWSVWSNDGKLLESYRQRCLGQSAEMTCAAQAAEILAPLVGAGETLLDVGCAGGHYYWSFASRGIPVEYHGLDYTPLFISLARREMCPRSGLPVERFLPCAAEHLDREFDTLVCFNVLSFNPHYGRSLETLLRCARKRILIRESLGDALSVRYQPDAYIDEGKRHLRSYFNTYPLAEVAEMMEGAGFAVRRIVDRRSNDGTETVCGVPTSWRILLGERRG